MQSIVLFARARCGNSCPHCIICEASSLFKMICAWVSHSKTAFLWLSDLPGGIKLVKLSKYFCSHGHLLHYDSMHSAASISLQRASSMFCKYVWNVVLVASPCNCYRHWRWDSLVPEQSDCRRATQTSLAGRTRMSQIATSGRDRQLQPNTLYIYRIACTAFLQQTQKRAVTWLCCLWCGIQSTDICTLCHGLQQQLCCWRRAEYSQHSEFQMCIRGMHWLALPSWVIMFHSMCSAALP